MLLNITTLEVLHIQVNHIDLVLVSSIFLSLTEMSVQISQERWKFTMLQLYLPSFFLSNLFFLINRSYFDYIFSITLLSHSIVLWFQTSLYQKIFHYQCISWCHVFWVVARCAFLVWKINQSIRCFSIENAWSDPLIYFLELLRMSWPVRRC